MVKLGAIWKFSLAFVLGLLVGYRIIPSTVVGVIYLILFGIAIILAAQNNLSKLFVVLPILIYNEVFVRAFARSIVPYLTIEYFYVIAFPLLFLNYTNKKGPHNKAFYLLIAFGILEFVNGFFPDKPILLKAIFFNTYAVVASVIWASYNKLTPALINKLLANIKIGAVYLTGIILVAHLQGKINYGNFSSSDASNGLAPVQISGYLGFASSMLFIGLMNPAEKSSRILNAILFVLVSLVMVLTFSRGGLYFLSIIVMMYLFYNRKGLGNYFKFLLLIPIAFWGFNFVVDQTGGAIIKRYDAKGSSNRDVLINAGFSLFLENPVLGVGTSNFGTAIVRNHLFKEESGAHNEFARAMAEHGIFGIITYWGFFIFLLITLFKRKEPERQYSLYFYVLFFLIVIHNGLKIGIQPLLLILAIANPTVFVARKKTIHAIKQPRTLQQQPS